MSDGWHGATKSEPCPVCGGDHRCRIADDGAVVLCYREDAGSFKETDGGGGLGWMHRLKDRDDSAPRRPRPEPEPKPVRDFGGEMSAARRGVDLSRLSADLGLPVDVLKRLGVGRMDATGVKDGRPWSVDCWAFPMTTPTGQTSCIRYRAVQGGRKFSASGDGSSLFIPAGVEGGDTPLIVIEGPTDCGACLAMGEDAVGRPNNTAGNDYLRQWIAFRRPRTSEVVVMIDRDAPDSPAAFGALRTIIDEGLVGEVLAARFRTLRSILTAAEVSTMQGAVSLARLLNAPPAGRSVTIAAPPLGHKDVRDWFRAGAKNDDLWGATEQGIKLPGRRLAGVGYAVGGAA